MANTIIILLLFSKYSVLFFLFLFCTRHYLHSVDAVLCVPLEHISLDIALQYYTAGDASKCMDSVAGQ